MRPSASLAENPGSSRPEVRAEAGGVRAYRARTGEVGDGGDVPYTQRAEPGNGM